MYHNSLICSDTEVWVRNDKIISTDEIKKIIQDVFEGKLDMKNVFEKKKGDIFSADIKNENTIRDKTNKAICIVDWISTRLIERPYGAQLESC